MRRQARFEFRTWGGKRRGAGRKRVAARPRVAHRPRETVNAQHPILVTCNGRKHGELSARVRLDPYSSAFALPDWVTGDSIRLADVKMQVALPRTWLLREGWRLAGPISPWDTPSA